MVSILPRADGIPFSAKNYDLLKLLARSLVPCGWPEPADQRLIQSNARRTGAKVRRSPELKSIASSDHPHFLFNALNTIAP